MNELKRLDGIRVNKNNNYITNDRKLIEQLKIIQSTFELSVEELLYPEYEVDTKAKTVADMFPCIFQKMYKNKDNLKRVGFVNVKNVQLLEYILRKKNDIVYDLLNENTLYFVKDGRRVNFTKHFTVVFIIE